MNCGECGNPLPVDFDEQGYREFLAAMQSMKTPGVEVEFAVACPECVAKWEEPK